MARSPYGYRRRSSILNRIYIVAALAIVVLIIIFVYRKPGGQSADSGDIADTNSPGSKSSADTDIDSIEPVPLPETEKEPDFNNTSHREASKDNPRASFIIQEVEKMLSSDPGLIIDARAKLNEVFSMEVSDRQRRLVKRKLSELADIWLFSRSVFPGDEFCDSYRVQAGDRLEDVGREYKVPYETLMQINNINDARELRAGQIIKVINGPFHAKVYRSDFRLDLYLQDSFIRSFPVGLGREGMDTPLGLWLVKVGDKQIRPTWTDPLTHRTFAPSDPCYPLGDRWIGLEGLKGQAEGRNGFAIHGTNEPGSIGKAVSQGCIRVENDDVRLLYKVLMAGFSKVSVIE